MEIKSKELLTASYKVTCISEDYKIEGNATIGANNEVTNLEGCTIYKGEAYVASFSKFGNNLNVNYSASNDLEEQGIVLGLIDEFKRIVVE
jgi:hypothetical protein